ncbi:hypothetical protein RN629_08375 [Sphingomonadaceae bacterium jetA1]|uniref:hypothetical protein n=1 Tax=Facivitalis istanbulensis TaxID=3075838 RepID=UPI003479933D
MKFVKALVLATALGLSATSVSAQWIASWGSAQMHVTGKDALPSSGAITLRQTFRLSAGGAASGFAFPTHLAGVPFPSVGRPSRFPTSSARREWRRGGACPSRGGRTA